MSNTLHSLLVSYALIAAAFLIAIPAEAGAQLLPHATVALVRELPDSTASATVIRTSSRTLVLLRERDADAATLATAMASVYRSQDRTIEGPGRKLVINLHGQRSLASLGPNERKVAEQYLTTLRNAKTSNVDGVGLARVTTIALEVPGEPSSRRRF